MVWAIYNFGYWTDSLDATMMLWGLCIFLALAAAWLIKPSKYFVAIFVVFSLSLYAFWGHSTQVADKTILDKLNIELAQLISQPNMNEQAVASGIANLHKKYGHCAPAVAQLGEIYLQAGSPDKAIPLFEEALKLDKNNTAYLSQWIYSHSLLNQGKLPKAVRAEALKQNQENNIINLLAIDDYFQGNYHEAIQQWEYLLKHDDTLSAEQSQRLSTAIQQAKQKGNS